VTSEAKPKKRFHVKTTMILILFGLGIYTAFLGPTYLRPISPVVVLPPEETGLSVFGFPITNTIAATLLTDLVLILIALSAYRFYRQREDVPQGLLNAFEVIVQFLWNTVQNAAGKWAMRIMPIVATIFLLIFTANLIKLLPGFESIGRIKEIHHGTGYAPMPLLQIGDFTLWTIDKGKPVEVEDHNEESAAKGEPAKGDPAKGDGAPCHACEVVPFLRGTATDINFPFALAVTTVFLTQVFGVWALGPRYFEKFFQFRQLVSGGPFGAINFGVGLLEIILEFAKILSFSFRLFGNIFAGTLLLSIVGALTAVAVPAGLYLFELFFGVIQAYVFFLLATIFLSGATVAHGHDEHH